jgi:importin subunit alpha-1
LVLKTGVVPHLIKLLDHPYLSILIPALRTLGNIVTGSDMQTTQVVEFNALPKFIELLSHDKRAVRREACWTLSNITAG